MSRSRSLWLWSPLVVLTVFFGVLGWRNSHLSMSEDDVFLVIPNYRTSTKILAPVEMLPFGDNETAALGMKRNGVRAKPLETALVKKFVARYPHMKFTGSSLTQHPSGPYLNFGRVEFQNRFSARCTVTHSCMVRGVNHVETTLQLTRSPLNLNDNEWHVIDMGESRAAPNF